MSRAGMRGLSARGIGSRKARRLLIFLAVHRGRTVGVDRIVDVLWGKPTAPTGAECRHSGSRLRAALGSEAIIGSRSGYRLGLPPQVRVDLDEAGQLIAEAGQRLSAGEPAVAVTAALRGLEMLGAGSLLVDEVDADWMMTARADAQRLMRDARHTTAAALLTDDPVTAIRVSG